ncbi:unnamed protein product [Protopolystoma xenopodis]|uniref:Uncharacterized protein n=1 Tax=Protopolystoma xenopodis TaxID=117903 RepID=A0A3S5C633_9PLAT|nr:unnamed protein product [Protopolystoma xenopodis]
MLLSSDVDDLASRLLECNCMPSTRRASGQQQLSLATQSFGATGGPGNRDIEDNMSYSPSSTFSLCASLLLHLPLNTFPLSFLLVSLPLVPTGCLQGWTRCEAVSLPTLHPAYVFHRLSVCISVYLSDLFGIWRAYLFTMLSLGTFRVLLQHLPLRFPSSHVDISKKCPILELLTSLFIHFVLDRADAFAILQPFQHLLYSHMHSLSVNPLCPSRPFAHPKPTAWSLSSYRLRLFALATLFGYAPDNQRPSPQFPMVFLTWNLLETKTQWFVSAAAAASVVDCFSWPHNRLSPVVFFSHSVSVLLVSFFTTLPASLNETLRPQGIAFIWCLWHILPSDLAQTSQPNVTAPLSNGFSTIFSP